MFGGILKPSRFPVVIAGYGTFLLFVTIVWNIVAAREVFPWPVVLFCAAVLVISWIPVLMEWRKYKQQRNNGN